MRKRLPFTPLKRARLYEEVAEQIKQAIFDGVLKPGDSLPSERDLCESFGVGRPTVREALRILSIMGLIEIGTGVKGSTVKDVDITQYLEAVREQLAWLIRVDEQTIDNLWEVRQYIEIGIAHCAAEHATDQDLERLSVLVNQMENHLADIYAYFPLAVEFHQELALATKNPIFYIVWNMFQDVLLKGYMPRLEQLFPSGPAGLLEANRVLLEAVKSRNPETIDRAMEFHVDQEKRLVWNNDALSPNDPGDQ